MKLLSSLAVMRHSAICPACERPGGRLSARFVFASQQGNALESSSLPDRILSLPLLHHKGCPASLAWLCSEQLKTNWWASFHRLTAHILSFLKTGDVTFDFAQYDGIYIILDRERALGDRKHGHHVHVIVLLAKVNRLSKIHTTKRTLVRGQPRIMALKADRCRPCEQSSGLFSEWNLERELCFPDSGHSFSLLRNDPSLIRLLAMIFWGTMLEMDRGPSFEP
jgi:hypothetical protein